MKDLIDRHEAIIAVGDAITDGRSWYMALKEVPSAEKKGKWILNPRYGTECSECGTAAFEIMGTPYSVQRFKYCPNCGARMEMHNENLH